jgi:hypothetical protein
MPDRRTLGILLDAVSAPGRTMIGMVAGFISERWPEIDRNGGRLQLGIPGRIKSESALCWPEALHSGHGGLAPLRSIFCRTGLNSSLTSHGPPREQRALC